MSAVLRAVAEAGTLLAHDLTGTRQTNVSRFRDGLQIAMDALGDDEKAREFRRILTSLHWLAGSDKPSVQLSYVDQIAESAEWLRDWHDGPDEDEDRAYEEWRDSTP